MQKKIFKLFFFIRFIFCIFYIDIIGIYIFFPSNYSNLQSLGFNKKGLCLLNQEKFDEAIICFDKSIELVAYALYELSNMKKLLIGVINQSIWNQMNQTHII